ncbi:MAG: hypothetical protein Q9186_005711 [Xanthomendoza sp. 1 TL-2023]
MANMSSFPYDNDLLGLESTQSAAPAVSSTYDIDLLGLEFIEAPIPLLPSPNNVDLEGLDFSELPATDKSPCHGTGLESLNALEPARIGASLAGETDLPGRVIGKAAPSAMENTEEVSPSSEDSEQEFEEAKATPQQKAVKNGKVQGASITEGDDQGLHWLIRSTRRLQHAKIMTDEEIRIRQQAVPDESLSVRELMQKDQPPKITAPREYQIELFERAKKQNTVAVLDTGSGKTLIAVLLLRHVLDQELEDRSAGRTPRVAFFLVDSVTLVFQQYEFLKVNLDQPIECFCGEMGTDYWELEVMLHSQIATTADLALLRTSVSRPNEEVLKYAKPQYPYNTRLCQELEARFGHMKTLSEFFRDSKNAASELGEWCADQLWSYAMAEKEAVKLERKIEKIFDNERNRKPVEVLDNEVRDLREAQTFVKGWTFKEPVMEVNSLSSKALVLWQYLNLIYERPTDARCIVFVKLRSTARLLGELFARIGSPHLRLGILIGTRQGDPGDVKLTFRQQMMTLHKFKKGDVNCLVLLPRAPYVGNG